MHGKASIIGPLIKVTTNNFCFYFLPLIFVRQYFTWHSYFMLLAAFFHYAVANDCLFIRNMRKEGSVLFSLKQNVMLID